MQAAGGQLCQPSHSAVDPTATLLDESGTGETAASLTWGNRVGSDWNPGQLHRREVMSGTVTWSKPVAGRSQALVGKLQLFY